MSRSLPPRCVHSSAPSPAARALPVATLAALVWANLAPESYASHGKPRWTIRPGDVGLTLTLREWVNSGLMTFFVVGPRHAGNSIWASCDSDVASRFRCWRAWGAIVPVGIFLALNTGRDSAAGWG